MDSGRKRAIGLDFGTSTTLVASPRGVVPIGVGESWIPSVVGYGDVAIVAGEEAMALDPAQFARSVKRSITDNRATVRLDTPTGVRDVRVDDLIVALLREAADRAATRGLDLGDDRALRIGCPAMWDGRQRRRLVELARRAGLPVTLASLVDEPVAAGIAWLAGHPTPSTGPLRLLVFDMGGGTLDIAVVDVRGANRRDVSVLAAVGVPEAGDALDEAIAEDLDYALTAAGVDVDSLSDPERARGRLRDAAREAKIGLSINEEHVVVLPRRLFGISDIWYTREQLNAVFSAQMDRAEQFVAIALQVARLAELDDGTAHDLVRTPLDELTAGVDVVLLSGGMSQIPYVAERLRDLFPGATIELAATPAESAVAVGLAHAPQYGRINMYRPAFDILLEWDHGREFRTVYEAYTPLFEPWQITRSGAELRYVRNGEDLSLPRKGKGKLRVVSHSGQRVRATLGGAKLDGFPVALTDQKFTFAIYPNGRISLTDGSGTHDGHVEDWYTLHGPDVPAPRSPTESPRSVKRS